MPFEEEVGRFGRIPEVTGNVVGIESGGIAKSSIGEGSFDISRARDLLEAWFFREVLKIRIFQYRQIRIPALPVFQ